MYKQDWIIEQIQMFATMIARLVFGKTTTRFIPPAEENGVRLADLHREMEALIADGNWKQAEDLLLEKIDVDDLRYLELGLDFYDRANYLADETLEACGLEREELCKNLRRIAGFYGVDALIP